MSIAAVTASRSAELAVRVVDSAENSAVSEGHANGSRHVIDTHFGHSFVEFYVRETESDRDAPAWIRRHQAFALAPKS